MTTLPVLNVTIIEPKLKHSVIFDQFEKTLPGDSFIVHNDHDPKPLYYQFIGKWGNLFTWEYVQSGPDYWKVKITRKKNGESQLTIGELVAKDFRKAEVFKKYNLDFCCGGKKTLHEACKEKKIDFIQIETELNRLDVETVNTKQNFDQWDLEELINYILNKHHEYVRNSIPVLIDYTRKVARVHGKEHPELTVIEEKFNAAANELNAHMLKEEKILFPYIKQLAMAKKNQTAAPGDSFGTIKHPINVMEEEHDLVGGIFKNIKELTNNYTPGEGACATYNVTFLKLKEFEEDLHQHIHLENNILFPKSIQLEKEIRS